MARTFRQDISAPAAIVPGTVVGQRYELQRRIGSGTYGEVWQAHDLLNGHLEVAVKLLRTELSSPEVRQRFAQECSALELLMSHPHIVAIRARGVHQDQDFMVLELLEGPSLADWLSTFTEDRQPELFEVMDLFSQICAGVAAAHRIKNPGPITHRDLKPENVMLIPASAEQPSGFVAKLLDFGIARLGNLRRTVAGQQLGTPLYMAPEQAAGDEQAVGPWSDVFSLGVILVEMLTLRPTGPEESSLRGALVRSGPRGLREYLRQQRPDVPAALWNILLRALATRPSDRYPDAEALLTAMNAALPTYCPRHSATALVPGRALRRRYLRGLGSVGLATCVIVSMAIQPNLRGLWHAAWMQMTSRPVGSSEARVPSAVGAAREHATASASAPMSKASSFQPEHLDGSASAIDRPQPSPLVYFKGGSFLMGSTWAEIDEAYQTCLQQHPSLPSHCKHETYLREYPQREVDLAPFALERTEVTNRQLAAWLNSEKHNLTFMPATSGKRGAGNPAGVSTPESEARYVKHGSHYLVDLYPLNGLVRSLIYQDGRFRPVPGREEMPALMVSWFAARAYCQSIGRSLPTEAQWEFAARGGKKLTYPWGNEAPRCDDVVLARYQGLGCDQYSKLRSVGASPLDMTLDGVSDLAGNAAEWVQDAFEKTYRSCPKPCRDPVAPEPTEPESSEVERVVRGGSWSFASNTARCATRSRAPAAMMSQSIGFRCALASVLESWN